LQRVAIFADRSTHQVKLEIADNRLTITAEDGNYKNQAKDVISCDYTNDPITIGFSSKYLTEVLKNTDAEEVTLNMLRPNAPALLLPVAADESEQLLMLLMPLMLNELPRL
jgi:DNA polymerase-3 subunit beta